MITSITSETSGESATVAATTANPTGIPLNEQYLLDKNSFNDVVTMVATRMVTSTLTAAFTDLGDPPVLGAHMYLPTHTWTRLDLLYPVP